VFNIDDKTRLSIRRQIERVLVVDPNGAAARLLTDLLTELGARQRLTASTTARALEITREFQPQLIFIEFTGPALDGVDFTQRLRRSSLVARRVPVVIVSADTREASIKAARDSGAHEFLCKPFTAGHVFRRVENVIMKPRPWIEAKMYVGPDRRRFNSGQYVGDRKRGADAADSPAAIYARADLAIRAQLASIETDPEGALHTMMTEAIALQDAAVGGPENPLGVAIGALQTYLATAMEKGGLKRQAVEQHLGVIRTAGEQANKVVPAPPVAAHKLGAFIV